MGLGASMGAFLIVGALALAAARWLDARDRRT